MQYTIAMLIEIVIEDGSTVPTPEVPGVPGVGAPVGVDGGEVFGDEAGPDLICGEGAGELAGGEEGDEVGVDGPGDPTGGACCGAPTGAPTGGA